MPAHTYRPMVVLLLLGFLLLGVGIWLSSLTIGHLISGQPWILPSRGDPSGYRTVPQSEVMVQVAVGLGFLVAGVRTFLVWTTSCVRLLEDRVVVRHKGEVMLSSPYSELESLTFEETSEDVAALLICSAQQKARIGLLFPNRRQIATEIRRRSPQLQ